MLSYALHFLILNAVCGRAERSRTVSLPAVQRLDRKRNIRRCSSRDRRQEHEQERVHPVDGVGQVAVIVGVLRQ